MPGIVLNTEDIVEREKKKQIKLFPIKYMFTVWGKQERRPG